MESNDAIKSLLMPFNGSYHRRYLQVHEPIGYVCTVKCVALFPLQLARYTMLPKLDSGDERCENCTQECEIEGECRKIVAENVTNTDQQVAG